ncbi:MAG TPA: isocitrate lyase/PEP mutase family protein [Alphaproteobacteria bacterium]|nr:isocitrate lyase/PEP mutase family protein [Alphaproteobacteria bacterium]
MSAKATPEKKTAVLRRLMKEEKLIVAPGVYDAYSARMTQAMGFKMAVTSGAGIANSHFGYPDLGIMTRTDNLEACRVLVRSLDIPLTADADTGYGNAVSAYHTVQMFEDIGVCGVNMEDQVFPKRCGHLKGKEIIPAIEMARKVEAASKARRDPDFLLVARTDALAIEGIEGAIKRGKMYAEAGADMLFADAVRTEEDIKRLVNEVPLPLTVNIGFGIRSRPTTPLIPIKRLTELGVKRVSVPRMLPAAALMGMRQAFKVFQQAIESDVPVDRPDLTFTIDEITELMDYEKVFGLERQFLSEDELDNKYRARSVV